MADRLRELLIQSLIDQKEIFGNDLFEQNINTRKTHVINDRTAETEGEVSLFEVIKEDWEKTKSLSELNRLIKDCTKCPLHKSRNKFVFGVGNPDADVMVVGEGPGAEEDKQGEPFVGRAGKLLNDILKAINFRRQDVYIANIVKCRPPGNRTPLIEEMEACFPYLNKQIELIKPKLILALGLTAAQGLLKKKESLTNMRGNIYDFKGIKTMVTYHPAALLRNPQWKRGCWEDVQKFRKLYDEMQ
ncbi:MAG TPA: uracil-DNA glycosylase [Ignavibacteriaceae bacterium]|nr:uracil-DNA glycosylase [Ignavibacteriaceae bacterium]